MKKPTKENLTEAIISRRGNKTRLAELYQCQRKTIDSWIKSYGLEDVVLEARNARIDDYEHYLDIEAKNGNVTAIIFFLKTQGKDRGYFEKQEHNITGGSIPIQAWIEKNSIFEDKD